MALLGKETWIWFSRGQWGISVDSIRKQRRLLGRCVAVPRYGDAFWTESRLALFGKVMDVSLARRWGMCTGTIAKQRRLIGRGTVVPRHGKEFD